MGCRETGFLCCGKESDKVRKMRQVDMESEAMLYLEYDVRADQTPNAVYPCRWRQKPGLGEQLSRKQ